MSKVIGNILLSGVVACYIAIGLLVAIAAFNHGQYSFLPSIELLIASIVFLPILVPLSPTIVFVSFYFALILEVWSLYLLYYGLVLVVVWGGVYLYITRIRGARSGKRGWAHWGYLGLVFFNILSVFSLVVFKVVVLTTDDKEILFTEQLERYWAPMTEGQRDGHALYKQLYLASDEEVLQEYKVLEEYLYHQANKPSRRRSHDDKTKHPPELSLEAELSESHVQRLSTEKMLDIRQKTPRIRGLLKKFSNIKELRCLPGDGYEMGVSTLTKLAFLQAVEVVLRHRRNEDVLSYIEEVAGYTNLTFFSENCFLLEPIVSLRYLWNHAQSEVCALTPASLGYFEYFANNWKEAIVKNMKNDVVRKYRMSKADIDSFLEENLSHVVASKILFRMVYQQNRTFNESWKDIIQISSCLMTDGVDSFEECGIFLDEEIEKFWNGKTQRPLRNLAGESLLRFHMISVTATADYWQRIKNTSAEILTGKFCRSEVTG